MTQSEFARLAEVSREAINRVINGKAHMGVADATRVVEATEGVVTLRDCQAFWWPPRRRADAGKSRTARTAKVVAT